MVNLSRRTDCQAVPLTKEKAITVNSVRTAKAAVAATLDTTDLGLPITPDVIRVVIDTNATGSGHFSVKELTRIRQLCPANVQVLVPEPVIWEWAEHARAAALHAVQTAKKVDPSLLSLAKPEVPSALEFCSKIEDNLPPGIQLWRPSGELARLALRAQALMLDGCVRRSDVKTGGLDHLVLACVREQLDGTRAPWRVAIMSGDSLLSKQCTNLGRVLTVKNLYGLTPHVLDLVSADSSLTVDVARVVTNLLTDPATVIRQSLEDQWVSMVDLFEDDDETTDVGGRHRGERRVVVKSIEEIEIESVSVAPEPQSGEVDRIGSGVVSARVSLQFTLFGYEQVGPEEFEMMLEDQWEASGFISTPISFLIDPEAGTRQIEIVGPVFGYHGHHNIEEGTHRVRQRYRPASRDDIPWDPELGRWLAGEVVDANDAARDVLQGWPAALSRAIATRITRENGVDWISEKEIATWAARPNHS